MHDDGKNWIDRQLDVIKEADPQFSHNNYMGFLHDLEIMYGEPDKRERAAAAVDRFTYRGGPLTDMHAYLDTFFLDLGFSDPQKKDIFWKKIPATQRKELLMSDSTLAPDSTKLNYYPWIQRLVQLSTVLWNLNQEVQRESRNDGRKGGNNPRAQNTAQNALASSSFVPATSAPVTVKVTAQPPPRDPDAMDVDRNRNAIRCYNCNKQGHMARDCPEPPKPRGTRVRAEEIGTNATAHIEEVTDTQQGFGGAA